MTRIITTKVLSVLFLIICICAVWGGAPALAVDYPFYDDMEGGEDNWTLDSPWGLTNNSSHSTSHSLSDSPDQLYGSNLNISATLSSDINLDSAQMPVLSFWHRHTLEDNDDRAYVEVSVNSGASWTTLFLATGNQTSWVQEKIDLSEYAGYTDVIIRFRMRTNASVHYDGWYIDDVWIDESAASISYPFFDDMEGGTDNWLPAAWELSTPGSTGDYCWYKGAAGYLPFSYPNALTTAGTLDLSGAQNPQLNFWRKNSGGHHVEVSGGYGHDGTYQRLGSYGSTGGAWVQEQVDLSYYAGVPNVRIRFVNPTSYHDNYIDDIRLEDGPSDCPGEQGDVNDDGDVNTGDAILALRMAVGLDIGDPPHPPDDDELCRGDVNCDGRNNTGDAILILRYSIGLILEFPCES